jgi:hypothetical protein
MWDTLTRPLTCGNFGQTRVQQREGNAHHCQSTPPLSRRLLRVSKAHELLHGIRVGSFDNDGPLTIHSY